MNNNYKHFKVINTSVRVAGRGLFKIKDKADIRVEECKTISNKFKLE